MKRLLLLPLAALTLAASGQSKLDLSGRIALSQYRVAVSEGNSALLPLADNPLREVINTPGRADASVTVLVRLNEGCTTDEIESAVPAAVIENVLGPIAVVTMPVESIKDLDDLQSVKSVSIGREVSAYMKTARSISGVDDVHNATGLDRAYKGAGVVTGLYDTGLDPNHINFFNSDGTENRVKRIWRFAISGTYDEYNDPDRISRFTTEESSATHGTHVLGIMAGSYNGKTGEWAERKGSAVFTRKTANPFYGVAPEADIAISCGVLIPSNYTLGAAHIRDYAASEGKPAVVNLSIGTQIGPHDGTDNDVAALDEVGKSAIVCVAAGNEGNVPLYLEKTFTSSDKALRTFVSGSTIRSAVGVLDIWGSDDTPFKFTPVIFDLESGETILEYPVTKPTTEITVTTSNYSSSGYEHFAAFDKAFSSSYWIFLTELNPNNNRYHAQIQFSLSSSDKNLAFGVIMEGEAGHSVEIFHHDAGDAPSYMTSLDVKGWSDGTTANTMNNLACGKNMIVVGSYNTSTIWGTLGKNAYTTERAGYVKNDISPFSSFGFTFAGDQLPHICAPGSMIVSSVSTHCKSAVSDVDGLVAKATENGRLNYWDVMQGTSMATPFVAGVVALWLEADPSLTVSRIREIMEDTAVNDEFTAVTPERWGAGKIDALAGIKAILGTGGVNPVLTDDQRVLVKNESGRLEVTVGGDTGVKATLYNMNGMSVASGSTSGNTVTLSTAGLSKGIYVVNVVSGTVNISRKIKVD